MLRFISLTVLMALIIAGFVMVGSRSGWVARPSFTNEIIFFTLLSTVGLYTLTVRWFTVRPENFVKIYLGTTVLRILFFGVFIFILIRLDKLGSWRNSTLFLVCYFLFTALEVLVLFFQINSRKKKGQKDT